MDNRLQQVLNSLLLNVAVLNDEMMRLARSEQFSATTSCLQMIEAIRGQCVGTLQNVSTIERQLYKRKDKEGEGGADVIYLE